MALTSPRLSTKGSFAVSGYGETEGGSVSLFSLLAILSDSACVYFLLPLCEALLPLHLLFPVLRPIETAASHPEAKLNLWSH